MKNREDLQRKTGTLVIASRSPTPSKRSNLKFISKNKNEDKSLRVLLQRPPNEAISKLYRKISRIYIAYVI
jgi:hypothetical protein